MNNNNNNNIILQPLREIGREEKSQFWDAYDIQAALREAYRLGINPQSLAASSDADDDGVTRCPLETGSYTERATDPVSVALRFLDFSARFFYQILQTPLPILAYHN